MSCHGCSKKFSLFTKEHGCPNCGFGYCKKCLDYPVYVQKIKQKAKVCLKCKNLEAGANSSNASVFDPPKAYLKMLEPLDNPSKPPITVYKSDHSQLKGQLSEADQDIANRLEVLKADRTPNNIPSEAEIRERLANLRGEPVQSTNKSNLPPVDTRSDQQKSDDLLKQYMSQCAIEKSHNSVDNEIEERLNKLRGKNAPSVSAPMNVLASPQDEESEVAKVLQQVLSMDDDEDLSDEMSVDSEEDLSESEHSSDSDK